MNWLKRIFTVPKSQKAALGALVDHQIDSLFDHNPPAQIEAKLLDLLSKTAVGDHLLGGLPLAIAVSQLDAILARNTSTGARAKVKLWARARLGL